MIHHTLIVNRQKGLATRLEPCFSAISGDEATTDLANLDNFLFEERSIILKDLPEFQIRDIDNDTDALDLLKRSHAENTPFNLVIMQRGSSPQHEGQEFLHKVLERYPQMAMLVFYDDLRDYALDLELIGHNSKMMVLSEDVDERVIRKCLQSTISCWMKELELLQRRSEHDVYFQELQSARVRSRHADKEQANLEKRMIKLEREVLDKDQLLAFFTYEIRTPLLTMKDQLHELHKTQLIAKQAELITRIEDNHRSLSYAIESSLAFLGRGKAEIKLVKKIFSPRSIVDTTAALLQPHAHRHQNKILVSVEKNVPIWVEGDEFRFKQILFHLLGNALKYTRNGTVSIRLKETLRNDFHSRLQFDVHDEGPGMDPGLVTVIRHMFEEPPSSHPLKAGNRGLHFCHRLAHAMDGRIWFETEDKMGTDFHLSVTLPMAVGSEGDGTKSAVSIKTKPAHILLIEDDKTNQRVFELHLKGTAHTITHAKSGLEGLNFLETDSFDLIFLDLNLPDFDGFEVCRLIRERSGHQAPIIAITANVHDSHKAQCIAAGMNDFVAKPITRQLLLKMIKLHTEEATKNDHCSNVPNKSHTKAHLPLDYKQGLDEFCGDEPMYQMVVGQFLHDANIDLLLCITALQNKDLKFIEDKSHIISGGAGNLCAEPVAKAAQHCELCAKDGVQSKTTEALFDLFRHFGQLEEYSRKIGIPLPKESPNENPNC